MAKLVNKTKNNQVLSQLEVARSFPTRAKGLIGTKKLGSEEGMWFPKCNWIHTFFMVIPIDTVYVDKKMTVKKIQFALKPWRLPAPVFSASSVFELPVGKIKEKEIEVGDVLHVGD